MWQLVLMINGYLITILSGIMFLVAAFDMYDNSQSWSHFADTGLFCLFIGMCLFLSNRNEVKNVSIRHGYLLTLLSWLSIGILSAFPFIMYGSVNNFADAFFESISGVSATGASVLTDIEAQPRAILLWRSILNGLGGIGVVIFAVALLPFLGIGGMSVFQRENSDSNEKFMPKFHYIAKRILFIYIGMVLACTFCLYWAGMSGFDAVNHALATIATGGFSTKNASIGYFNSVKIEVIISTFMIMASLPISFYVVLMQNKLKPSFRSQQVLGFLKIVLIFVLATAAWLYYTGYYDSFSTALRYASFNVISTVSTTGFASTDFLAWGALSSTLFAIFSITGGCTGSTTGSVKIFRWQVVWAHLKQSLLLAVDHNRIAVAKIKNYVIDGGIISSVLVFMTAYFLTVAVLVLLMSINGHDFSTSFASVIACITNTGPGNVASVGPAGNFAWLSDYDKYLLCVAMLLGRLEILTVLVVFTKNFWRS